MCCLNILFHEKATICDTEREHRLVVVLRLEETLRKLSFDNHLFDWVVVQTS
jgi:hypothetical protein